jgi:hypothetical protein
MLRYILTAEVRLNPGRREKRERRAEERYIITAYMKAMSWRKGCDMRYSDMELYGPRSGFYRYAVAVRTDGYSMATLPPLIWQSWTQFDDSDMK